MIIYSATTTSFNNNGYGELADVLSAKVTEVLNGDMYLNFSYPINSAMSQYLVEGNLVKCDVGKNEQVFRINRVTKNFSTIEVYALHIFYDLLDNFLNNVAPTELNCQSFGGWILSHTNYNTNFTFSSDIPTTASARYVRKNPIEAIIGSDDNSMVNIFGGYLERDNYTIKFNSNRGQDNGYQMTIGKNITDIQISTDITSLATRLCPVGFDGLTLPEVYVDSSRVNDYPSPKIAKVEFNDIKYDPQDENAYHTLEEAYQSLRNACNTLYNAGLDLPVISIKINWLELSKTQEYHDAYAFLEKVNLGDTITANILSLNYETMVVKTIYNVLTKAIEQYEIGTISSNIVRAINNNNKKIEAISIPSILESAKNNATSQITTAMGGYVYKTTSELYIMDTDNPATAQKVWRWNMNGLGYSSNGINGTYGIAMTQDGQIVADFITTGTLQTSVIQGYDQLVIDVGNNGTNIADTRSYFSFDGNNGLGIVDKQNPTSRTTFKSDGMRIYVNNYSGDNSVPLAKATADGFDAQALIVDSQWKMDTTENNSVFNIWRL